ncbi:hypothetical protein DL768_000608 [Monosporascus sp. mg162]|nr:hypothetical protein DL768_000608 [Monosporascus sp. mg162]
MELDDLDTFETVAKYDARNEGRYRAMSILVMAEFPAHLRDLREQEREDGEEYLSAAFMTALTLLHDPGSRTVGLIPSLAHEREHAIATLADFHPCGEGWVWNPRSVARFRIPQHDAYLCPEIDLPVATDDVVGERMPCPPQSGTPVGETSNQDPVPSPGKAGAGSKAGAGFKAGAGSKAPIRPAVPKNRPKLRDWGKDNGLTMEHLPEEAPKLRLGHSGGVEMLSVERCESSLDELKRCLSQLIDVSLNELEKLFGNASVRLICFIGGNQTRLRCYP